MNSPRSQAKRPPRARRRLARLGAALVALSALGFVPGAASSALAASCSVDLRDGGGYLYDVAVQVSNPPRVSDFYGVVNEGEGPGGASDSWDLWGSIFVASPGADPAGLTVADKYLGPVDGCAMAQSGQEIRFPAVAMKGLEVQRSWFADPGPLNGARLLTVLRNPSAAPISVTLVQGDPFDPEGIPRGDLGSDDLTFLAATSDGTGIATPAARWGVTTDDDPLPGRDSGDPTLAHVWDGPGGAERISEVVLKTDNDTLFWTWDVTVPPGATVSFVSYEIQSEVPGRLTIAEVPQAVAQAEARQTQSLASLYRGMSAVEIAGTMNWAHPAAAAAIKPVAGANSATPLLLDGAGSLAAPPGLPQCGIASYAWKADDGAAAAGPTFSHFFKPGAHKANLTVTSSCGASASTETSFMVAPGLRLGKVKLNRSKGTATVQVKALGAGRLTLAGKGVTKLSRKLGKAGAATLLVRPTGKARNALLARGQAKVRVVVSLKPAGGPATTLRKALSLKLGD